VRADPSIRQLLDRYSDIKLNIFYSTDFKVWIVNLGVGIVTVDDESGTILEIEIN
jgi:hypothetical protein